LPDAVARAAAGDAGGVEAGGDRQWSAGTPTLPWPGCARTSHAAKASPLLVHSGPSRR